MNGSTTLENTLANDCLRDCEFAVGDSVTILDAAANNLVGEFFGLALFDFATGGFEIVYDRLAGDVRLLVTEATSPMSLSEDDCTGCQKPAALPDAHANA